MLEDLQFTDAATIELLAHLTPALAGMPVVFAASLREPELAQDDARARALRRCLRHATHVSLSGLSPPEVAELVVGLGATAADHVFSKLLFARTQGNPFFVRQLVSLLQQTGKSLDSSQLRAAELPPAVRGVIRERLIGLAPASRALLSAAAVIGEAFDLAVLTQLRQCGIERVLVELEPALAMSLVRAHDRTPHRFAFCHVLLRDVLYEELGLGERGQLHARMWQLLTAQSAGREAQHLASIARHGLLALPSKLEASVRDCLLAAEAAHHASGFEAAVEILQRALDKVEVEGGSAELRCQLLLALGMSQMCAGEIGAALGTHERGARLARDLASPEMLARFVGRLSDWLDMGGDRTDVALLLGDALERVRDAPAAPRATLLAQHAAIGEALAPADRARLFDEAEQLAHESGRPEVVLEVAMARVNRRDVFHRDESRRAIAAYRSLAQHHRETTAGGHYQLRRFSAALTEYLCALTEGQHVRIQLAATQCEAIASESHVLPLQQAVEILRAGRALAEGRLDELAAAVDRLREGSSLPGGLGLVWIWYALQLAAARGESIERVMSHADLSVLQHVAPRQRNAALVGTARVIARAGHHLIAQELVKLSAVRSEDLQRLPNLYGDLGYLCSIVELRWELRDPSDVPLLEHLLLPHAELNAVGVAFDYNGSVAHYLGLLSLMQGRREVAIQRLQMACAHNEQLSMPLQLAWTRSLLNQAMS